jgi:hypothetical protein
VKPRLSPHKGVPTHGAFRPFRPNAAEAGALGPRVRSLRGRDIDRESRGDMSKHQAHPTRGTQILVHGDPHLKLKPKTVGHHLNEVGFTTPNTNLTDPDSKAGANRRKLREVIVGSQREQVRSQSDSMLTQKPGRVRVAVETDEGMHPDGVQVAWYATNLQIATVGK